MNHHRNGIEAWDQDPVGDGHPAREHFVEACSCCVGKGQCPWCGSPLEGDIEDLGDRSALRCSATECGWSWKYALNHVNDPIEVD